LLKLRDQGERNLEAMRGPASESEQGFHFYRSASDMFNAPAKI